MCLIVWYFSSGSMVAGLTITEQADQETNRSGMTHRTEAAEPGNLYKDPITFMIFKSLL
jgi:hypothetical protein